MSLLALFDNLILLSALAAWATAQIIKVPIEFYFTRRWNWALLFQTGGMPSSHSALVAGLAHATGLRVGYDSPAFAVAFVLASIVIYDATGIRRQAGHHATIINQMISDLALGHPLKERNLKEVLGHSPLEALVGTLMGVAFSQVFWWLWP
jgi:hypothetical protein